MKHKRESVKCQISFLVSKRADAEREFLAQIVDGQWVAALQPVDALLPSKRVDFGEMGAVHVLTINTAVIHAQVLERVLLEVSPHSVPLLLAGAQQGGAVLLHGLVLLVFQQLHVHVQQLTQTGHPLHELLGKVEPLLQSTRQQRLPVQRQQVLVPRSMPTERVQTI